MRGVELRHVHTRLCCLITRSTRREMLERAAITRPRALPPARDAACAIRYGHADYAAFRWLPPPC